MYSDGAPDSRLQGRDKVLKAVAKTRERNWESFVNSINGFERNPKTMPSVGDWDVFLTWA